MINKPTIAGIVAMAENRVIGKNNQLPWHLPADLKHFKEITTGHPILMGRKTHESIGKPLPNRTNIILTRDTGYKAEGCVVVNSIKQGLEAGLSATEIFIIGGEEIYRQALPFLERIYLTIIHHTFEGDAYFPELSIDDWHEIAKEEHPADDKNLFPYSFVTLARKHFKKEAFTL